MNAARNTTPPTRTCVGCATRDAQAAMLRLRRAASGSVVADPLPRSGRSAYVHARPACVGALVRSKGLGKSLRATITKEARLELARALEARLAAEAPAERKACDGVALTRATGLHNAPSERK